MKLRMKLLVVEDANQVQRPLQEATNELSKVEFVGSAVSAKAAILLMKAHRPETVIIDLHLSDGSGLDAVRAVKDVAPDINVVALTDATDSLRHAEILAHGADYLFEKGEHFDQIRRLMRLLSNIRYRTMTATDAKEKRGKKIVTKKGPTA